MTAVRPSPEDYEPPWCLDGTPPKIPTLDGQDITPQGVGHAQWSPTGRFLAVVGGGWNDQKRLVSTVTLLEGASSGSPTRSFSLVVPPNPTVPNAGISVTSLAFNKEETLLACSIEYFSTVSHYWGDDEYTSHGSTVFVWDLAEGRQLLCDANLKGPLLWQPNAPRFVAFDPQNTLLLCDLAGSRLPFELPLGVVPSSFSFSPEGNRFAVATQENVYIIDAISRRPITRLKTSAKVLVLCPEGDRIAGAEEHEVWCRAVPSGALVWRSSGEAKQLSLSPSGRLVLGSLRLTPQDGSVCVRAFDSQTGDVRFSLTGFTSVILDPTETVASGIGPGRSYVQLRVSDQKVLVEENVEYRDSLLSPDGECLAVCNPIGGSPHRVLLWHARRRAVEPLLSVAPERPNRALVGGQPALVVLCELSRVEVRRFPGAVLADAFGAPTPLIGLSCGIRGNPRAFFHVGNVVRIFQWIPPLFEESAATANSRFCQRPVDRTIVADIPLPDGIRGCVRSAIGSPDGALLAVAIGKETLVFRVAAGRLLNRLCETQVLAFSPFTPLCAGGETSLRLLDAETGAGTELEQSHTLGLASSFSDDGLQVSSVREDGTVWVWGTSSGSLLLRLAPEGSCFVAAAFHPLCRVLACAEASGAITFFSLPSGQQLGRIVPPPAEPFATNPAPPVKPYLGFSPDAYTLLCLSPDGVARCWCAPREGPPPVPLFDYD